MCGLSKDAVPSCGRTEHLRMYRPLIPALCPNPAAKRPCLQHNPQPPPPCTLAFARHRQRKRGGPASPAPEPGKSLATRTPPRTLLGTVHRHVSARPPRRELWAMHKAAASATRGAAGRLGLGAHACADVCGVRVMGGRKDSDSCRVRTGPVRRGLCWQGGAGLGHGARACVSAGLCGALGWGSGSP